MLYDSPLSHHRFLHSMHATEPADRLSKAGSC